VLFGLAVTVSADVAAFAFFAGFTAGWLFAGSRASLRAVIVAAAERPTSATAPTAVAPNINRRPFMTHPL
jgi:hypothetical protein